MDILTFLSKLVEHSAWPIALVIILLFLRKPIDALLARLNKVKHKDILIDFETGKQQENSSSQGNISIIEAMPKDTLGIRREVEDNISLELENLKLNNDKEKVRLLIAHFADLQIKSRYFEIYQSIYGSQISLLGALNTEVEPVERKYLENFYDIAKRRDPDFYSSYLIGNYINFLITSGLVKTEGEKYLLTVLGRGFLTFMTETGRGANKIY